MELTIPYFLWSSLKGRPLILNLNENKNIAHNSIENSGKDYTDKRIINILNVMWCRLIDYAPK